MSEIMVLGSTDGFSGVEDVLTSFVPLTAPTAVPKVAPYKPIPSAPASGGLFSSLVKGIGNVGNWFTQNSQGIVQALDAAGRLKSGAKTQADLVNEAYYRNIVNTPPQSWFEQETIPGLKNSVMTLLLVAVVGGAVFMSRKNSAQAPR